MSAVILSVYSGKYFPQILFHLKKSSVHYRKLLFTIRVFKPKELFPSLDIDLHGGYIM